MALFLSTFENKVDSKGRVSVPSSFRSAVSLNPAFLGVVLYRSFTSNCIEGCSIDRMEAISDAADSLEAFSEKQDDLTSLIFADARQLAFDGTGRIIIPDDLLKHAGIKDKAAFVGRGKTFQIWNPADFEKEQEEARKRAYQNRPTLKISKLKDKNE